MATALHAESIQGSTLRIMSMLMALGDLDECNGREGITPEFPEGTYYYVITNEYPGVPRCFVGTPSSDFKIGPG